MSECIISRRGFFTSESSDGKLHTSIIAQNMQFIVPKAINNKFDIRIFGGGGSGGIYGGGGGGWMNNDILELTEGDSIPIIIGEGGYRSAGGGSSFGVYLSANGGSKGETDGGNGGSGGGGLYDGGIGYQFGGGGGITNSGDGGPWGGGGGAGSITQTWNKIPSQYYYSAIVGNAGKGGTYGGNGGRLNNWYYRNTPITVYTDAENGTNTMNDPLLNQSIRGYGYKGNSYKQFIQNKHYVDGTLYNVDCGGMGGGGGYGGNGGNGARNPLREYTSSTGGSGYVYYWGGGGGGGYGGNGGGPRGGGGGYGGDGGNSIESYYGILGGGGGYGHGGESEQSAGLAAGGSGGGRYQDKAGNGGKGVCIIQYYT